MIRKFKGGCYLLFFLYVCHRLRKVSESHFDFICITMYMYGCVFVCISQELGITHEASIHLLFSLTLSMCLNPLNGIKLSTVEHEGPGADEGCYG